MSRYRLLGAVAVAAFVATSAAPASAITRPEMMTLAESYRAHTWTMLAKNVTASCSSSYSSGFSPGTSITGVAYKWGGFDSLAGYISDLDAGYGAGSGPSDGVLPCVTGVDCSGYVSRCWGTTQKYGTATIHNVSHPIPLAEIIQGDAFNRAGSHIVLWDEYGGDGSPDYFEATPPKVIYNSWATWGYLSSYEPIRYDYVEGGTTPVTGPSIIAIRSLPFHDERNTLAGASNWSSYSCAPDTGEAGPEIIYLLDLDAPGTLTATITDGVGVDVDIHLLSDQDPNACVDRDHLEVGPIHVAAGSWVLVVDSWSNDEGYAYAGAYTLDVTFTPDGGACPPGACGTVCGMCPDGQACTAGTCESTVQLEPCGEVSYEGECDGATLTYCSESGLKSGTCESGCCGWVSAEVGYNCYEASACGTCKDECDSSSFGCSLSSTHAWSCVDPPAGATCRVRSWVHCEDGCDPSTGKCSGAVTCTPSCDGKSCGDDGCGGICGTCAAGYTCEASQQCVVDCTPACDGAVCGDDGCAGSCGTCPPGSGCVDGQCISPCTGSCAGKACGDDGCGNSCGSCPAGGFCHSGICVAECLPTCSTRECGPDGCGGLCGICPGGESCHGGHCVSTCAPNCFGRECGDDGCGGSCGGCSFGLQCQSGQCAPIPPDYDTIGGDSTAEDTGVTFPDTTESEIGPSAPTASASRDVTRVDRVVDEGCASGGGGSGGVPFALGLLGLVALASRRRGRGPVIQR